MIRISNLTRLICIAAMSIAAMSVAPMSAQTGPWTPPVALSVGGQGWEAAAAIDDSGNSLALWDERTTQDQLWSRAKVSGGNWGAVTRFSPSLETVSVFPVVKTTPAGFATAVWTNESGVWFADRPAGSSWRAGQLLISGVSSPIFVTNSAGDAAIVWTVGDPVSGTDTVMAMLRPAGGSWTAQQTVGSGTQAVADHAGISANGAVVVTWETYTAICSQEVCSLFNYVLHASRQDGFSGTWADSGPLLGPDNNSHEALAALDSSGDAMLVAMSGAGAYTASTQGSSGGAWSAFKNIVNPQEITITTGLASDDAGRVTLVYETISLFTSQVIAFNGSMRNNSWSPLVVLSPSDTVVGQLYFALAPSTGAATVIWLSSGGTTPQVHAVTRLTSTGTWSKPVGVSGPGTFISPEAVAINSSGSAVAIYSGYNAADVHTEYATSFQP